MAMAKMFFSTLELILQHMIMKIHLAVQVIIYNPQQALFMKLAMLFLLIFQIDREVGEDILGLNLKRVLH